MKIVNGRRVYAAEIGRLVKIDNDGWDTYDDNNYQYYTLSAAKLSDGQILYKLGGSNSGSCYGDYSTHYVIGGKNLMSLINDKRGDFELPKDALAKLLGDIDESNLLILDVLTDCGL